MPGFISGWAIFRASDRILCPGSQKYPNGGVVPCGAFMGKVTTASVVRLRAHEVHDAAELEPPSKVHRCKACGLFIEEQVLDAADRRAAA